MRQLLRERLERQQQRDYFRKELQAKIDKLNQATSDLVEFVEARLQEGQDDGGAQESAN